jgi:tetratricopeptide (TPR) repeat protein
MEFESLAQTLSTLTQIFSETRAREDFDTLLEVAKVIADMPGLSLPAEDQFTVWALDRLSGSPEKMAHEALSLAGQMFSRYESTQNGSLLPGTALLSRIATVLGDTGTEEGRFAVVTLGMILRERFRASSDVAFLLESVALLRRTFQSAETGSKIWATAGSQLAIALEELADEQGESWTLDQSISLHEELLRQLPENFDTLPFYHNYDEALRSRYVASAKVQDIDRAIVEYRMAVAATDPGDPAITLRRMALAQALFFRHTATEAPLDLDEAIDLVQTVLYERGVKSPKDPLLVLASYLLLRFDQLRSRDDLRMAEAAIDEAILRHAKPEYVKFTLQGLLLLVRWETTMQDTDLDEAAALFQQAMASHELVAPRWALAAIGRLQSKDEAAAKGGERALSSIYEAGLDQPPPADAMTVMAKRFYLRHCGEPDLIHEQSEGVRDGERE